MSSGTPSCYLIGEDSLLVQCGEILLARGYQIHGVVAADRNIRRWAEDKGIRAVTPSPDDHATLATTPFDFLFSIANLRIIRPETLALARKGAVNFHDGPLPRYGGLYAPAWALMARETTHGITWHRMTDRPDAGDILVQRMFGISEGETSLTLNTKCYAAGIESFPELLDALEQGRAPRHHTLDKATFHRAAERPAAGGALRWNREAAELDALVRALDFGAYPNPLALPKVMTRDDWFTVRGLRVESGAPSAAPGTVVSVEADSLRVSAVDADVTLTGAETHGLKAGDRLPVLDDAAVRAIDQSISTAAPHEAWWVRQLAGQEPLELPYAAGTAGIAGIAGTADMPGMAGVAGIAGMLTYLGRLGGKSALTISYRAPRPAQLLAEWLPFTIDLSSARDLEGAQNIVTAQRDEIRRRVSFARDVFLRVPSLKSTPRSLPVALSEVLTLDEAQAAPGSLLTIAIARDGSSRWLFDPARLPASAVERMQAQAATWLHALAAEPHRALAEAPIISSDERTRLLETWNDTALVVPQQCVHDLTEAQARRTPDAIAVSCEDKQITYRELSERAARLASYLHAHGVGPDTLVGLSMERSIDMLVGLVGILKAGGAYVPLDPSYPADRIAFMLDDSGARVLVTQQALLGDLPDTAATVVCLDADWPKIAAYAGDAPGGGATPANLAYVIYTSGSTGRPKGVMVEHRNVVNFFAAMDQRLGTNAGTWLAVTSLSFDISVLELLWTLSRGYKVVVHAERAASQMASLPNAHRGIDFSLFYFSANENERQEQKYRLLLEGAKYADRHGFAAVWTPERHFHAFGGLYPNPSVTGAALATITKRVQIRAGSCVLPLHHPVRVAEEWSVVDNLSNGRVGISFAAGWQPDDFIIRPESYANAKQVMIDGIETVRRLWRGESIEMPGPRGPVQVRTLPRPVQPELPVWVTTAGTPETWEAAGRIGASVLTHLLGQSVDDLAGKITLYRRAWRGAGHQGEGTVSLMLHTFVGDSDDEVKALVRQPMKDYLRTSISLIKGFAEAFPTFRKKDGSLDFAGLSPEDMDALLDYSFERYYQTSGLFGTIETCAAMVDRLKGIGVDDIACLVDFGVDADVVLRHLEHLNRLRAITSRARSAPGDYSPAAEIARHRVTHLQCTPSMASMLVAEPRSRDALRSLRTLLIGGEAFPAALAAELQRTVAGDIHNMYGPTETTIWSAMHTLDRPGPSVPIGRPIANTSIYIVDAGLQPVPVGVAGELLIGGDGVVRGYLGREELTAERFIASPFGGGRLYRTGDLARYQDDGTIEFLGRIDHQVKIRGYRIELGEIESLLARHPQVREAVVVAREDTPGDRRLVAYIVPRQPSESLAAELKEQLRGALPEYMVPSHVVPLRDLPRTPNQKIDRKALPAPAAAVDRPSAAPAAPPESDVEEQIAAIWREVLKVPSVGVQDNFFDLGGHSLLAVQIHGRLRKSISPDVAITDLFRFPTIRGLAAHLSGANGDGAAVRTGSDRAEMRRQAARRPRR